MTEPATRIVQSVDDLLQSSELVGITPYEISAKRAEQDVKANEGIEPVWTWQVLEQHHATEMQCRFRATVEHPEASYLVDFAAVYRFNQELEIQQATIQTFIEKVAVMAVYPFLREAIFTSACRLALGPPVLGLIRQGDFKLDHDVTPDGSER